MRRVLFPIVLLAAACATTQSTTHEPSGMHTEPAATTPAVSSTAPPCNPAHALVNAVIWTASAAEHDAATLGTFANARRALDAALADPTWSAALEDTTSDASQPPAIILDLDETILDNAENEVRWIRKGVTYDSPLWKAWVRESAAAEIPGAKAFLAYAQSRGVIPFYITNRDPDEREGTRANLEKLGYPLSTSPDNLLMRGERPEWKSDKSSRRAWVASTYRVLLLLGDDLNDFADARDKSLADRDGIVEQQKEWWGTRWFMLPNPMYGSWERAAAKTTGTPCEQLEQKIDALKH
jgi:acid phosphatase